ncbi:MAG: FG-GAP repeat protein [Planctomycetota bacterium]
MLLLTGTTSATVTSESGQLGSTMRPQEYQLSFEQVAATDTLLAAPAVRDSMGGDRIGGIYLFDIASRTLARVYEPDTSADAGTSLSIDLNDQFGVAGNAFNSRFGFFNGAAFIFDPSTGQTLFELEPDLTLANEFSAFGLAVAVDGATVAVGAPLGGLNDPGYVSVFDANTGQRLRSIQPPAAPDVASFGNSVAIEGDMLVIGAPGAFNSGSVGRAYVYQISTGALVGTIEPNPSQRLTRFGDVVAISNGRIAISAPGSFGEFGADAVIIYDAVTRTELRRFIDPAGLTTASQFGAQIDLVGDALLIATVSGSPGTSRGRGNVWVYNVNTGARESVFEPATAQFSERLGPAIALNSTAAFTTTSFFDTNSANIRLVYEFPYTLRACPADLTTAGTNPGDPDYGAPDGSADTADLSFFVEAWLAGSPSVADLTTDGANPGEPGYGIANNAVTVADLAYFVELWLGGCP